jgi:rhamnosyltransferase
MRAKWSMPIKKYWKWSEKKMIGLADLIVCDSENIEKYINREYGRFNTKYIAYGADVSASTIDDIKFDEWLNKYLLKKYGYYLVVGRFVPENNYEIIMKEFMKSHTSKCLVLVTNDNGKLAKESAKKLNWKIDERIKFVGTIYDQKLIKKIRENAFAYLHGHEVGGTNPSLLEALASTKINLLLKVGFNEEVGQDAALYWSKEEGSLASLIESVECMDKFDVERLGLAAKQRIIDKYSWEFIGNEYKKLWKYISHH